MSNSAKKFAGNTVGVSSACVIVKGTIIEGDFKSNSDTRMDGIIKGNVTCSARMIMGKDATIEGNVKTKQASISGVFTGDLSVDDLLSLTETAKVDGTVTAKQIEVSEGALLNGTVLVGEKEAAPSEKR